MQQASPATCGMSTVCYKLSDAYKYANTLRNCVPSPASVACYQVHFRGSFQQNVILSIPLLLGSVVVLLVEMGNLLVAPAPYKMSIIDPDQVRSYRHLLFHGLLTLEMHTLIRALHSFPIGTALG